MSKLKVAICTDGIYPHALGGMQKHSRLLIEALAVYSDLDITVIHPHPMPVFDNKSIHEIQVDGIDEKKFYLSECYSYSKRVYRQLLIDKPDIVYSQGLSVWYRAKDFKGKLVLNPHGLEPFQTVGFKDKIITLPIRKVFSFLFKRATIIISLGGKLTEILRNKLSNNSTILEIPNAARVPPDNKETTQNNNIIKALFLARFAGNKGIDVLFSAIDELKNQNLLQHFEFTLGGTGPLYQLYKERNIYKNVRLAGFIPDDEIAELYLTHDVFIFPTLYEGMPTVVLEAMSYGLPIIVSDVGATTVLVDQNNGKVISPGSVSELVDSLKWFLSLTDIERKKLSKYSSAKFRDRFTWPVVAKQYYELFKLLAASK